jgi:hypothetical protein
MFANGDTVEPSTRSEKERLPMLIHHGVTIFSASDLVNFTGCAHPDRLPWSDRRSVVHPFTFPPQDFKMRVGDKPLRSGSLEPAGEIVSLDEDERVVELKLGPSRSPIEPGCGLIPEGPICDRPLRAAVHRYAEDVAAGGTRYEAVSSRAHRRYSPISCEDCVAASRRRSPPAPSTAGPRQNCPT